LQLCAYNTIDCSFKGTVSRDSVSTAELGTSDTSNDISIFDTYRIQKKVSKYWTNKVSEYCILYYKFSIPILRYCIEKGKKYRTKKVSMMEKIA
jgi:hypothetical protein